MLPRCKNVGRRSRCTPSARSDRAISAVFRDRSARCAADSRSFSPRGLLWLFLRKKEQEKTFAKKCGSKPAERTPKMVGLRTRRSRPAWRESAAASCRQRSAPVFLCTFGLTQKYQKAKHGEKSRVASTALAERAQKTALFAHPLRALAPSTPLLPRFSQCGRAQANGLRTRQILTRCRN